MKRHPLIVIAVLVAVACTTKFSGTDGDDDGEDISEDDLDTMVDDSDPVTDRMDMPAEDVMDTPAEDVAVEDLLEEDLTTDDAGDTHDGDAYDVEVETIECTTDEECDDGRDCTVDSCDTDGTHTCINSLIADGTPCRYAAGECDVEETCDGSSPDCPADIFADNMVECRAATDQCDAPEFCTGTGPLCPDDAMQPSGHPCRDDDPCTYPDECDGSGTCISGPASGLHDVAAVSVNRGFACALMVTGGVKCWGGNTYGELGDGTTTGSATPVDVVGLSSGATDITAGYLHACTVTAAGSAKCWGANSSGQLGDGTTTDSSTPVDVVGLSSGVVSISAGTYYTCALLTTGGIKCWGWNGNGQLGDGTTTDKPTPVDVVGLSSGVAAISAGSRHACALTTSGGVKCWGGNNHGQVGDGTTTNKLTPVDVWPLSSGVSAVSASKGFGSIFEHTCALMDTGGVKCWGGNIYGAIGDGTTTEKLTPVDVSGLSSGVAQISTGEGYSCAVTTVGGAMCWGYNLVGMLGDGTTTSRLSPVSVSGLSSGVAAVSAGWRHTCALMATGGVMYWGESGGNIPSEVVCE